MNWTLLVIAAAYLPLFMGISGSLHLIAHAMRAQNKHYGIPATDHAVEPKQ